MFESTKRLIRALLLLSFAAIPIVAQADGPGGILENISNAKARTPLTTAQIASFLPSRGKFTFPAPYNTTGYRITNASDCGGNDCVDYVGYSFWRNMDNSAGSNIMYIMVGLQRSRGGQGPTLFSLNKTTGVVTKVGPIFDSSNLLSWTTGEGDYFSYYQPTKLWVTFRSQMIQYDVLTHKSTVVFDLMKYLQNVNIATASSTIANLADSVRSGATYYLHESHTSNNDLVHSATVETSAGSRLGCIVFNDGTGAVSYFPSSPYKECNIGRGGRWLMTINGQNANFINLATGKDTLLLDRNGAPGHADMGFGYMIGADNWAPQANTFRLWNLATMTNIIPYHNYYWYAPAPNHISWTNARSDIPISEQHVCGDSELRANMPEVGEVLCFNLNTSGNVMVAAPVMTNPNASGGSWQGSYGLQPKGNLDPTGQYFIWTSNMGGSRMDAFVVSLPTHLLNDPTIANGSGGSIQVPNTGSSGSSSGSTTTPVTTPPVISAINATASSTSVMIDWTTDKASDTQVDYGLTTSYGSSTTLDTNLTTSHSQTINNLRSGTTYHYQVKSRDAAGNLAVSGDLTFTTATATTSTGSSSTGGTSGSGTSGSTSGTSGSGTSGSTGGTSGSGGLRSTSGTSGSTSGTSGSGTSGSTGGTSGSSGSGSTGGTSGSGTFGSTSGTSGSSGSGSTGGTSGSGGSGSTGSTSGSSGAGSTSGTSGSSGAGSTGSTSGTGGTSSSGSSSGTSPGRSRDGFHTGSSDNDSFWHWRHWVHWVRWGHWADHSRQQKNLN